jgi:predicted dithiol-disulfide oxidoreductase (DUF899 family)
LCRITATWRLTLTGKAAGVLRYDCSVFYKNEAGEIFSTYSSFACGEDIVGAYRFLDIMPKGRDEGPGGNLSHWVRHHDRYEQRGA